MQSLARCSSLLLVCLLGVAACAPQDRGGPFDTASQEEASAINARLGASYLQSGELQQAHDKLNRALEQDPDNADAHAAYGILQARLDDPETAEEHFERALRLDPDNPQIKNNFATMLCEQGDYDRAIDLFLEAADDRLYETPAFALANAGTCARDAGRPDEAREHFLGALDEDPGFHRPRLELAELAYEAERPDQATEHLERYHERARQSARSLWLGVQIERMRGDRDAAEDYGRSLVRHFPDSDEAEAFLESR